MNPPSSPPPGFLTRAFPALLGAFLCLVVLKFNNLPIMEQFVDAPNDIWKVIFGYPWPISWAYALLLFIVFASFFNARPPSGVPRWFLALPVCWLLWQFPAAIHSVDGALTGLTVKHLVACVGCFYLGSFALARAQAPGRFWLWLFIGYLAAIAVGWEQHFGGLADTRTYFMTYVYPTIKEVPPEYLKRVNSTRIFGTAFYANALAGLILLLMPPLLAGIWKLQRWLTVGARQFLMAVVAVASLGALFWSGSKGGWLLMLALGLVVLLRLNLNRNLKLGLIALVLIGGLAGFAVKYKDYFKKGATSAGARFDYWAAALRITADSPILGEGPGTFAVNYAKLKRPESEMTRMVHNDYLEQFCDSGLPGGAAYFAFIACGLALTYPRKRAQPGQPLVAEPAPKKTNKKDNQAMAPVPLTDDPRAIEWFRFCVWLGVLGWGLQEFMEFGLYLPTLAWPAMTLLGWLVGTRSSGELNPTQTQAR